MQLEHAPPSGTRPPSLTTRPTTSRPGGIYHSVPGFLRPEHECLWLARVIGRRNGGDRCGLESGRSNRSPEFHFQFPNCGSLSPTQDGGHRLLLLLFNGCDQCAPPATQKVHLPPSTKGPTFSPKVNWETKFVRQCSDVQEPECGDSLVGGGGMRLAYCAIMRPEKHAIGCTRCAAHHSCTHSQHEWPVPANRAGNPRKDISIKPRNLRHIMHSRANSTK